MSLRINSNIAAMNAYRNLSVTDGQMSKSLEKLSSGFRINRAADDAAGLSISEGMRSQIGGLKQAVRNTQDGINVVQTADGALNESTAILQRMRDLSVQASNDGSLDGNAKDDIQTEMTQLKSELDRIAGTTQFNGKNLLDGSYSGTFQVGANAGETISVGIGTSMSASGLGVQGVDVAKAASGADVMTGSTTTAAAASTPSVVTTGTVDVTAVTSKLNGSISYGGNTLDLSSLTKSNDATAWSDNVTAGTNGKTNLKTIQDALDATFGSGAVTVGVSSTNLTFTGQAPGTSPTAQELADKTVTFTGQSGASAAITQIDAAITKVSTTRATLGAYQNRFEHTVNNLNVTVENLSASESQIRDTDMAQEMTNFTKNQILQQAGTAMLAQANQAPQSVLKLLG